MIFLAMLLLMSCQENNNIAPREHSIFNLDGFWSYRTADMFMDGGSVAMGFVDGNGEILYVFFDYSIESSQNPQTYRKCRLQRTFKGTESVEIPPGSELEAEVITFISEAQCSEALEQILPSRDKAIDILRTRDTDIRLINISSTPKTLEGIVPLPNSDHHPTAPPQE